MKRVAQVRVPDIEDQPTGQALLDLAAAVATLEENAREYFVAVPLLFDAKALGGIPIFTPLERSELVQAWAVPDVTSGGYAATAISFLIGRVDTPGTGLVITVMAQINRASGTTTAWEAGRAKAMQMLTAGTADQRRIVDAGQTVFLSTSNDGIIPSWLGAVTLKFRRLI